MSDTQIKVDTGLLREYASRLKKVNSRLKALEGDLEALYRREGLVDIGAVLRSGDIGWSKTIDDAATYLLETADDFENVEKEICDMLDRSMQGEHPFAYFDDGQQPWTIAGGLSQLEGNEETQSESDDRSFYAGIVLTPQQLESLSKINDELLEMLDEKARANMESGVDNLATIFTKLSYEQQEQIDQWVQDFMDTLTQEQKTDLRFLNSRELIGVDFEKREAILQHLRENQGEVTYADLVAMGVCTDNPSNGSLTEELMSLIPGGNPADWPAILEEEYVLNQNDTSFAELDAEEEQRRAAEGAALFMIAAAPLLSWGVDKFSKMMNQRKGQAPTVKAAEPAPEPIDSAPLKRGPREETVEAAENKIKNNLGREIDITPSSSHRTTPKNPGYKGNPNSSVDILDDGGNIQTRRWFGPDGKAVRDIDMTNHGNPKKHAEWPHEHIWQYGPDGKPTTR